MMAFVVPSAPLCSGACVRELASTESPNRIAWSSIPSHPPPYPLRRCHRFYDHQRNCMRITNMLYTVTLFKRVADNFKTSAHGKGFQGLSKHVAKLRARSTKSAHRLGVLSRFVGAVQNCLEKDKLDVLPSVCNLESLELMLNNFSTYRK